MTSPHVSPPFAAHGFHFQVHSPEPDIIAVVNDLLVGFTFAGGLGAPAHRIDIEQSELGPSHLRVSVDGEEQIATLVAGSLISHLLIEINERAAANTPHRILLHAGAVRLKPSMGRGTILLPGASHSGKTTLTTALALEGWPFVADEVSALNAETLGVDSYGKPVALRPASVDLFQSQLARLRTKGSPFDKDERFVPPTELGGLNHNAAPVVAFFFPSFQPDCADEFVRLSPGDVLTRLMHSVLNRDGMTPSVFRSLEAVARRAPAYYVQFTDMHDAIDKVCSINYTT